jgi:hypothetical protein
VNKLSIVTSGRKQSGKNSTCNYILAKYLNRVGIDVEASELTQKLYWDIDEKGNLRHVNVRMIEKWESANSGTFVLEDHSKSFEILPPDKFASSIRSGREDLLFRRSTQSNSASTCSAQHTSKCTERTRRRTQSLSTWCGRIFLTRCVRLLKRRREPSMARRQRRPKA